MAISRAVEVFYCPPLFCGSSLRGQVLLEWVLQGTRQDTEPEATGKFPFEAEFKSSKPWDKVW